MRITIDRKDVGAILSALFTITSLVYSAKGIAVSLLGYSIPWQYLVIGGFGAFWGFTWWKISELRRENNDLRATRPSVVVGIVNQHNLYTLEVKNTGNTDTFEAQIRIPWTNAHIPPRLQKYKAWWEIADGVSSKILNNSYDRILIAKLVEEPPHIMNNLRHYYYDIQTKQKGHVTTIRYGIDDPQPNNEFKLEVTISSTRGLIGKGFSRDYRLTVDGLEELPIGKRRRRHQKLVCPLTRKSFHELLKKASQPIRKSEKEKS